MSLLKQVRKFFDYLFHYRIITKKNLKISVRKVNEKNSVAIIQGQDEYD